MTIIWSKEVPSSINPVGISLSQDNGQIPQRLAPAQELDRDELRLAEQKVRRKLDIRLLGMAWVMLLFNHFDRYIIAAARVIGIQRSLHINSTQYGLAVGILYVGYILMQVPSNLVLTKLRPSIYLPTCMIVWGIVSACTGLVHKPWQLYLIRFILGFVEAPFTVGALFLISSWYTRSELGVRSAIVLSASFVSSAVSGPIAAGITDGLEGACGLQAWRWMFIIAGVSTVVVGSLSFFSLPDFPSTTPWLSSTERAVAEWRLILDAGDIDEEEGSSWKDGFNKAWKDWRVYVFAAMYLLLSVASSVHNFFPAIVQTLGFSHKNTLLLTAPPYVVAILVAVLNNWSADRTGNSSLHAVWPPVLAIIGFSICAASLNTWTRYFAMILMIAGGHGANAIVLSWAQKTMVRPRAKRACALGFINATGTLAQISTSFLYPGRWAPRYIIPMSLDSSCALAAIVLALAMRFILQHANEKLARHSSDSEAGPRGGGLDAATAPLPLGSNEQRQAASKSFRYIT